MENSPTPGVQNSNEQEFVSEKEGEDKRKEAELKNEMMNEMQELFALREKGEYEIKKALSETTYLSKSFTKDAKETNDLVSVIMNKEAYPTFTDFQSIASSKDVSPKLKTLMDFAMKPFEAKGGENA